ncbi:MAG TPA: hypothetical protein VG146_14550 [Verrucomicrobiae bacterium]|nr:hypothetical protein [Verrucomicrobiae bacterium]
MPLLLLLFTGCLARGAVINVQPGDNYSKIEAAHPGDQVLIAPGSYAFRVYLTQQATPTNPIVIQAQDPANPPVWDFGTTLVENAPGSYTAGDRGRGGWQFSGAKNYSISGIVFRNCRTASFNSAGIRYYYGSTNIYVKDCVFTQNDNGITGGSQDSALTVEFCEIYANGNTNASASSPTHNLYIYGGTFTMRYCYVHDSVQAENFHIRSRNVTLEYNWFARAKNYEGDLMTDDDFTGAGPYSQAMTLRGNVILQAAAPSNHGQVIALYNDNSSVTNLTLSLRAAYNTFIGNGGNAAFVHLSNADKTRMNVEESDNILFGTTQPYLIENAGFASLSGQNNWLQTNAAPGMLSGSIQSAAPGFRNAATKDYTLSTRSACIGAASPSVYGLPGKEYFRNEITNRFWRIRSAARDLGSFESTSTSSPIGPYDPVPRPMLAASVTGSNVVLNWPLFAQDFQLDQSSSISPAGWAPSGLALSTNATGVSVIVVAPSESQFFRLQK